MVVNFRESNGNLLNLSKVLRKNTELIEPMTII